MYGVVPGDWDVVWEIKNAALTQKSRPQLDADDAEYEKDKEAEQQNVAEHWKRVEQ